MDYLVVLSDKNTDWTKPLWEFRVVENYTEDTSLILYKFHHSLMDGVGFASIMSSINDDQFTSKINKQFVQPSIMLRLKAMFNSVILLVNLFLSKSVCFTDQKATKMLETNRNDAFPSKFYTSHEYDFKKIVKCYKQYPNMTFNDYMMSIFSKSCHQLLNENGVKDAKELGVEILVNMRQLPTRYEDIILCNYFVSFPFGIQLFDNISAIYQTLKPLTEAFKSQEAVYTVYYLRYIIMTFIPKQIFINLFADKPLPNQIFTSNIAFSDIPWRINGKEIRNISINIQTVHGYVGGLSVYTYNGKARFGLQYVRNLKMDYTKLIDNIISNLDEEISNIEKSD